MKDYRIFYQTPKGKYKLNIIIQGRNKHRAELNFNIDFPKRKVIKSELFFDTNKTYRTPSGLGGMFTVKYQGKKDGKFIFNVINPDFQDTFFHYTPDQAEKRVMLSE